MVIGGKLDALCLTRLETTAADFISALTKIGPATKYCMTQLHRNSGEHEKNMAPRLFVRLSSFEMCTGALMVN
jgi:hypothetical protein